MEAVRNWSSIIGMAEETGAAVQDLDAQLMLRFKDGDTEAFDRLFVKHMRSIVNFAYRFVRNREIAEELAQEYRRVDLELDDFNGPRYTRLTSLKQLLEKGRLDEDLRWVN